MHDDFEEIKSDMPLEDILTTIRSNCGVVTGLQREIERLEKAANENVVEKPTTYCRAIKSQIMSIEEQAPEDEIGEEAAYFINVNDEFPSDIEELRKYLRSMLPSRSNGNYHRIIQRIRLDFIKAYNEYIRLVEEEKASFNKMDIELLTNEANKYKLVANLLHELEYETELDYEEEPEPNRIVFMTKASGRPYIQDDLEKDKLTDEHMEEFAELLDSIIDGSFTGAKRLIGGEGVKGICEVKVFGKRILYDRIGPKVYAVITGFIKKTDSNKGYREFIGNRINIYRAYENMMKAWIDDPEYMAHQEELLQEVYKSLGRNIESPEKREVL